LPPVSCWYLAWLIRPWRWRRHVSQNVGWHYGLHGIISQ
jgi:hypothetical protein